MSQDSDPLPTNFQAEQLVLGVVVLSNTVLSSLEEFLQPDHFAYSLHAKIYRAMQQVYDKSFPISIATLEGMLHGDQEFVDHGKSDYLVSLSSMAVGVTDPLGYARIIHQLALRRSLIAIATDIIHTSHSASLVESVEEQIAEVETKLFNLTETGRVERKFAPISSLVRSSVESIDIARKDPKHITGISSGLLDLDKKLSGFQNSDLVIIAGRPSMGKTALAVNIALNIATGSKQSSPQRTIGFFSLEMSSEQLAFRMLSIESGINSMMLRSGSIKEEQYNLVRKKADLIGNMRLFIDDTPAISIATLRSRARRLKRREGVDIIFVDYLQLLKAGAHYDNRVLEISEITQGLKALAKELNVPVVTLSQLSRAVEQRPDKRPILADLRDSGTIEQDADIVMFIYREEYYLSRVAPEVGTKEYEAWQQKMEEVSNLSEVIIAKHRNGPIGNVQLFYDNNLTKFANSQRRIITS
jgi:replicative DNA helicase